MSDDKEFLKILLEAFRTELDEGLRNITNNLIDLEKAPFGSNAEQQIEKIYRDAHSLKGASRAVNLTQLESVFHSFEGVMSSLKNKNIRPTKHVFDTLNNSIKLIIELAADEEKTDDAQLTLRRVTLIKALSEIEKGNTEENSKELVSEEVNNKKKTKDKSFEKQKQEVSPAIYKTHQSKDPAPESVRVDLKKLDLLQSHSEELIQLKAISSQFNNRAGIIKDKLEIPIKEYSSVEKEIQSLKKNIQKNEESAFVSIDNHKLKRIMSYLEWLNSTIKDLHALSIKQSQDALRNNFDIETAVDKVQNSIKEIITVPFSYLLSTFPGMVRDIANKLNKEVQLEISGSEIQIDRRILESIRNPLMHIIRNSVDYGIEKPEDRIKNNKTVKGTISIVIDRISDKRILINITDDGKGVNFEKLRTKYLSDPRVHFENKDEITDQDLINYMFHSGVSTSDIVTDISGRGLGLAIVREKVEFLNGTVNVQSEKDKGTSFLIEVPVNLMNMRGLVFRLADQRFVLQTTHIDRIIRIPIKEISTVEAKTTYLLGDTLIPVMSMSNILSISKKEMQHEHLQSIVLKQNDKLVAFVVDEILDEQEILVKNFNHHIKKVKYINGATITDDGAVLPVLNPIEMVSAESNSQYSSAIGTSSNENKRVQKKILVVEDSITSRTLLKNILETENYDVTTANDGVDALEKLQEDDFHAIVSDVEMPRMNGFDLTKEIRSDQNWKELPVILVTSLTKTEDREKGIEVGADAYIVKSDFDQSNLLDVITQLI